MVDSMLPKLVPFITTQNLVPGEFRVESEEYVAIPVLAPLDGAVHELWPSLIYCH